jgi:hypothetical protein
MTDSGVGVMFKKIIITSFMFFYSIASNSSELLAEKVCPNFQSQLHCNKECMHFENIEIKTNPQNRTVDLIRTLKNGQFVAINKLEDCFIADDKNWSCKQDFGSYLILYKMNGKIFRWTTHRQTILPTDVSEEYHCAI